MRERHELPFASYLTASGRCTICKSNLYFYVPCSRMVCKQWDDECEETDADLLADHRPSMLRNPHDGPRPYDIV